MKYGVWSIIFYSHNEIKGRNEATGDSRIKGKMITN